MSYTPRTRFVGNISPFTGMPVTENHGVDIVLDDAQVFNGNGGVNGSKAAAYFLRAINDGAAIRCSRKGAISIAKRLRNFVSTRGLSGTVVHRSTPGQDAGVVRYVKASEAQQAKDLPQ